MFRSIVTTVVAIACVLLSFSTGQAEVLPATGDTTPGFDTNPELDGQTLINIKPGGVTRWNVTGATAVTSSGSVGGLFGAPNEGVPASTNAALSGLGFTTGRTNMQQTDYTLGVTVNPGDPIGFFFGEIGLSGQTGDAVTVIPLSGGSPIASWSLGIVSANYGPQSGTWTGSGIGLDIRGRLTTFSLGDFTGGAPGTLVNVDGIRLWDNVGGVDFDPNILGTFEIPEPSTMVMLVGLAAMGLLGCLRRRR